MDQPEATSRAELGALSSRISREIVRLHAKLYGRGPTKAKTHLADDHALCILEEVFTPAEKTLIRAGNTEQVKATRDAFQEAVEPEFRAVVEAASGRKVRAFVSVVSTDIDAAFELFLFENGDLSAYRDLGGNPFPMAPVEEQGAEEQIAREVLAVHQESYGVGAKATHVHILGDFVLVALDVELTSAEQTLLDSGKAEAVTGIRESYQEVIGPTFSAIVERATGRRVTSFVSQMCIDPLYALEIFRLAPAGGPVPHEPQPE